MFMPLAEMKLPQDFAAVRQVEASAAGAESAVRTGHLAMGVVDAQAGTRGHDDHEAGLVAILGGRRTLNHLHGLHGVDWNLIGEDLALLIGDLLPVDRE